MRVGFDAKRIFHNNTGLGNYGRDIIRGLHEHTPVSKLILYNTKPSRIKRLEPLAKAEIRYPRGWLWNTFSSIWRLGPVSRQILEDRIHIFHGLSGETPTGLRKMDIPTVVTIHDLIFLSHPHYYSLIDRIIYKRKFQHATRNADKIIAISEQTKRDIIKYLHIDDRKIRVIYQGCNKAYKERYSNSEKAQVIEKFGLPVEFILNVGTLQERKNALTIVKAIRDTKLHLVLIGNEKTYARKIHAYIRSNSLENQVIFLKNVPVRELAIIYQLATVFCYPSICEGFGIPIIEALYSKTPVITSVGSCFPEAGGPASVYIDPENADILRSELQRLFMDPELRKQMAEQGHAFVQKFRDDVVAEKIHEIYTSVLSERLLETECPPRKISALMITYNEIEHIDEVLENLDFADEIIIVDSFSNDGTAEKIKKHPKAKLIQRNFKNYTDQKSYALQQASNDWILFMDADERITTPLKTEILKTISRPGPKASAYYFYRVFMFKKEVLRYSGWQTDKNYRLFRKSKVHFLKERIVHETLVVDGISGSMQNKLIHYSYKNYGDYKEKMIKYGMMKAQEEVQKSYEPNLYHFVLRPTYKFLNQYIFRLGILDGKKGMIISYLNALGVYVRYRELRRLRQLQNRTTLS